MKTTRKDVVDWLEKIQLRQSEWAKALGVNVVTVYLWIHKGGIPQKKHRAEIEKKYPDCPLLNFRHES